MRNITESKIKKMRLLIMSGQLKVNANFLAKFSGRCRRVILMFAFSFLSILSFGQQINYFVNVNTIAAPPVNPLIQQYIQSGNMHCTFTSNTQVNVQGYAVGRIERLSPSPFTITMNASFRLDPSMAVNLVPHVPVALTIPQMLAAFGQFDEQYLNVQGINIGALKDANNNIKLPAGTYKICFAACNIGPNHEVANYYSDPQLGCGTFTIVQPPATDAVIINTQLLPPANPDIVKYITDGNVRPTLMYNNGPFGTAINVKVFGKIESLSPNPFTISLNPSYFQQPTVSLSPNLPVQLTSQQVIAAFGNFNEANLITSGINLNDLKSKTNVLQLPEGLYRICFYARYDSSGMPGGYASNINLGCANFNICYKASAPQFTQPVSNFNIQNNIPVVKAMSPVIFTWTPPNATCGLNLSQLTYDFELREMYPSQTITDAINNPPLFTKTSLHSSSFLLDTMLYKQVLQRGKLYVIRVKANAALNSPIVIDNNGYSRVEPFVYGDTVTTQPPVPNQNVPQAPTNSSITTSNIKGKVVWSFKKAEEEMPPQIDNSIKMKEEVNERYNAPDPQQQKTQTQEAIDPNARFVAMTSSYSGTSNFKGENFTSTSSTTSSAPQLTATVVGAGELMEKKDLNIASENGKIVHPLEGATVLLMGVKVKNNNTGSNGNGLIKNTLVSNNTLSNQLGLISSGQTKRGGMNYMIKAPSNYQMADPSNQEEDLIGSGTTDADGNFSIHFIDPKFKNINQYSSMHLLVNHEDFETYSQYIKIVPPDANGDMDLGTLQVLAKTFRFTPYVTNGGGMMLFTQNGTPSKIELYYPSASFNSNSYYSYMVAKSSDRSKKTIAGKEYIKIADLQYGETINKLFYQHGSSDNFIIQITSNNKEDYRSYMGVIPVTTVSVSADGKKSNNIDESEKVISVKERYTLKKILPFITGSVKISAVDETNAANNQLFYASGAVVTVSFDPAKVVERYSDSVLGGIKTYPASSGENGEGASNTNVENYATKAAMNTKNRNAGNITATNTRKGNNNSNPSGNSPSGATSSGKMIFTSKKVDASVFTTNKLMMGQYSTISDDEGNFRIDNLPVLQDGSFFTVTVTTTDNMDSSQKTPLTLKRGDSAVVNFQFSPDVYTVTGIAVDEAGNPLSNAILKWKSGGNPIEAQSNGLFVTSNYKDDYITISNPGYISKTVFIKLNKNQNNKSGNKNNKEAQKKTGNLVASPNYEPKLIDKWANALSEQPSVKSAAAKSGTLSPSLFGYAAFNPSAQNGNTTTSSKNKANNNAASNHFDKGFAEMYKSLLTAGENPAGNNDVGKIGYLEKGFVKINFVVNDASSKTGIANAVIKIDGAFDTTTDNKGEVLYKEGGSSFTYTVSGPAGSDYIIQSGEVGQKEIDGTVITVNISLEHGIQLSGKITSKSANIPGAKISVDGKDYINTTSKADGSYSFYIPKGESKIVVTKETYYGASVDKTFTTASIENFELKDGGGKNISKLLGFDIVLKSATDNGAGQKWTGSFVNLKSNSLFTASSGINLNFSNINVTFDAAGNAQVADNKVQTDATELPLKLYGYIPINMEGSPVITVTKNTDGKGVIGGKLQINFDQVGSIGGIAFDNATAPLLLPQNTSIDADVPVFTSDGSSTALGNFVFSYARADLKKAADNAVANMQDKVNNASGDNKAALQDKLNELKNAATSAASYSSGSANIPSTLAQYASVKVFGFEAGINLAKCSISTSGIDMNGYLVSPNLPIISSLLFDIDKLSVGTGFSVKDVSVKSNMHLKFSIASWSAEVNAVSFNMNGFKVGGKIEVQVPQSPTTDLEFSNLSVGSSGLYGGSFSMPSGGLNIFNIINLQTGSVPLIFGEVGNSGVYKIGGSAKFSFAKLFTESIDVPYFQIQTDGKFGVTVPVNKSLNAGFAKFALNSITFNTTTATPQIDIDGTFSTDVKLISFRASGIHFKPNSVSIDKIGLGIDIPGTSIDGSVEMKENGFAGGGSLSIDGTPVKVAIDFHYFKTNTSVDLGANFVANVKIPLGPVIITKVGGGFTYRSNPEFFSVTITGGASVTGFETLVALDPISITVESGPKITGTAHVKLASSLDVAQASIVIDIPNLYFAVGIVSDFEPLPDILKTHVQGDLIASAKPGDSYFFFGAGMDVDLLGLIHSRGVLALGFGVNNAQTRPTISYYLHDAPSEYLSNGSFTGIYLNALSEMGVKEQDAPSLDLGIVSGKLWLYSKSNFSLIADFNNANFRISAGMHFEGGIQACVIGICASASAKACVDIAGGFNDSQGWNFSASASGEASLGLGSDCDCNSICTGAVYAGAKICVGAGAKIRVATRQGGLQELSMFIGSRSDCN